MSVGSVRAIAGRVLRRQLRNRAEMATLVLVPIVLAGILGFADKRGSTVLPVGLVRNAHGPMSDELSATLQSASAVRFVDFGSIAALNSAVRTGDVTAGVIVPSTYDDDVAHGADPAVTIVGNPKLSTFRAARADVLVVASRARVRGSEGAAPVRVERITASSGSHSFGLGRFTAGMLVFFIFDGAIFGAAVFSDDRRRGVIARMATTPNRPFAILAGELTGRLVLGLVAGSLIVLASVAALRRAVGRSAGRERRGRDRSRWSRRPRRSLSGNSDVREPSPRPNPRPRV